MASFWATITQTAASVVDIVMGTAVALGAASGGTGMTHCLPCVFQRGQSSRKRTLRQRTCAVDRAVHDQWLMWRN